MWYDVNTTLSHNKLLNFVVGQRGVGKTYSCKRKAISNYLKNGGQFVYLRRYDTEIKLSQISNFFDDIWQEFEGHELEVARGGVFKCDGNVMGWALPLSRASQYKSVPFPNVDYIIFDEFIIDQGLIRYLPDEVTTFNEMYSTIARLRDVKVLFLSNAITFTNPYFLYFGLKVPKNAVFYKKGDILVHYVNSSEYGEAASSTRFGAIIKDSKYGQYAIANQFLRDNEAFIRPMPEGCNCTAIIKIENTDLGLYQARHGSYYISTKKDTTCKIRVRVDKIVDSDQYMSKKGGQGAAIIAVVLKAYFDQRLYFTDQTAKNLVVRNILSGI